MTEYKFSTDNMSALIKHFAVDELLFTQLCDWILVPKNLQQFIAVAENMNTLLSVSLHSELAAELGLDKLPIEQWRALLRGIQSQLPNIPKALADIQPNELVRPLGLIGSYPIYATLTASEVDYPPEETEKIRAIHLIGMSAAITYKQIQKAGIIQELSSGFEVGLLEIRELEKIAKRPTAPLPD